MLTGVNVVNRPVKNPRKTVGIAVGSDRISPVFEPVLQ